MCNLIFINFIFVFLEWFLFGYRYGNIFVFILQKLEEKVSDYKQNQLKTYLTRPTQR